jgi:hypothetical protein
VIWITALDPAGVKGRAAASGVPKGCISGRRRQRSARSRATDRARADRPSAEGGTSGEGWVG